MFSQWGRWGKTSVQTFSNRFLKISTERAVTTKAGSLFQYFTTLTEWLGFVNNKIEGMAYVVS